MEEQYYSYPPFPRFIGQQWKRRRTDLDIFRIFHVLHLLPEVFEIGFCHIDFIYFKSVTVEEQYPLWLEGWQFSATKINFEKPPEGGGLSGLIRNSTKSARLRFHCQLINRGNGIEVVKVYTITYFKRSFICNENEFRKTPARGSTMWTNPK